MGVEYVLLVLYLLLGWAVYKLRQDCAQHQVEDMEDVGLSVCYADPNKCRRRRHNELLLEALEVLEDTCEALDERGRMDRAEMHRLRHVRVKLRDAFEGDEELIVHSKLVRRG